MRPAIEPVELDDTDREILRLLLKDGSMAKAEIGRAVGMTANAVFERLRKLQERGIVEGYTVRLSPDALGFRLLAFVFVAESKPVTQQTGPQLARIPNIEEVHRITGKDCFLVKVRAADTADLTRVLDEIGTIASVAAVETKIVLQTFREEPFDALLPQGSTQG